MTILRRSKQLLLILFCINPTFSFAEPPLKIVIEGGVDNPLPIAIIPFGWSQANTVAPIDLAAIISANLARSGRFNVMDEQDLPQRPTSFEAINFSDWDKLGMENILIGELRLLDTGEYGISFRLIDIHRGRQIAGFHIPAKATLLRRVAHQISDIVFEKLTGMAGSFDTRIAYITVRKDNEKKIHTLQIADADGHNAHILVESPEPLLSPSWSPDGSKITYVSFEDKSSAIYIQDLLTSKRIRIAAFSGINSAPAWSPDGSHLAMTLSKDGNTEIYIIDLRTKLLRRLTKHSGIDTEPTWSPDGQKLAFTSDRSGSPQIYEINTLGGNPKRLSFEGKYNARPAYSPDGESITLVHGINGSYRIGLLDLSNGHIDILTDSHLDESPSFAPNGALIIYATTAGVRGTKLATVSTDGRIHQRLGLRQGDVREPAWGPFSK